MMGRFRQVSGAQLWQWHARAALSAALCGLAGTIGATSATARIMFFPSDTVARQSTSQGEWHLTIARDKFSGELACQLKSRDGRGLYRSGGVGFKFHFVRTVTDAVYRIDRGDAHASRDDLPRLIALNTPIDHGSMADPSDGVVWVPYDRIAQAQAIAIEPQRGDPVRVFHLRGLATLHDLAIARGCAPESRFVEK
ncbi:hypothetical protein [Novosphingobium sp.]|uniref:hypothetical protein n=1 Tax=Novosphingobium sp. TaxID=1874826 RepID=UPI003D0FF0B8